MSERGRYETAVATFIGLLALVVSAYTAYVQRQQARAQVMPILQFSTSNIPHLMVGLGNKGVGPALINHVVVTVDGQPMRRWHEGDCWILRASGRGTDTTAEVRACPKWSERTFLE